MDSGYRCKERDIDVYITIHIDIKMYIYIYICIYAVGGRVGVYIGLTRQG